MEQGSLLIDGVGPDFDSGGVGSGRQLEIVDSGCQDRHQIGVYAPPTPSLDRRLARLMYPAKPGLETPGVH